jgi:hypothetical protein
MRDPHVWGTYVENSGINVSSYSPNTFFLANHMNVHFEPCIPTDLLKFPEYLQFLVPASDNFLFHLPFPPYPNEEQFIQSEKEEKERKEKGETEDEEREKVGGMEKEDVEGLPGKDVVDGGGEKGEKKRKGRKSQKKKEILIIEDGNPGGGVKRKRFRSPEVAGVVKAMPKAEPHNGDGRERRARKGRNWNGTEWVLVDQRGEKDKLIETEEGKDNGKIVREGEEEEGDKNDEEQEEEEDDG